MGYEYNPPEWQPDAVASEYGWKHPKTGELLISIPGGVKTKSVELPKVVAPVQETKSEDQQPRRRGRPRKNG